jgi:hypothetical protein
MIDAAHPYVSWYLWIVGVVFAVCFVIPLLVVPLRWAKVFRWQLPADNRLTTYFGRSLGAVAAGVVFATLRVAPHPAAHPVFFEIMIVAGGLLTLVHAFGALERSQPWTETAEIPAYAALTIVSIVIYRVLF